MHNHPAGSLRAYAPLALHAQVLEQLLPSLQSIAFFDPTGRLLSVGGPAAATSGHMRSLPEAIAAALIHGRECVHVLGPHEYAAVLMLYTDTRRSSCGACLLTFAASSGAPPPTLDAIHARLDPALACLARELARLDRDPEQGGMFEESTAELDWLLEISGPGRGVKDAAGAHNDALSRVILSSIGHLGCALGAVLVPERGVRLVRTSKHEPGHAEDALRVLEGTLLNWVRRKNEPMLVNKGRAASARSALRLLAIPIAGHTSAPLGALVFIRSMHDPAFGRVHLAVGRHLARHIGTLLEADVDPATGLYTRAGVQRRIEGRPRGAENRAESHAVVCINIDRLHAINEMSGFNAGDAVIRHIAQLLRQMQRDARSVAARISGNEFAVVLPGMNISDAERAARALQRAASQSSDSSDRVPVSLSCGIASFVEPSEFESALALAELACQAAKDHGRGRVEVYQDEDSSMIRRHLDIGAVGQVRDAIRENRLTLFAQRVLPIQGQDAAGGYELLLRSRDPPYDNRAPAALLAAAANNQLASELDLWVIEYAIATAKPYRSELLGTKLSLSINITGSSLTDEEILQRVQDLVGRSGLEPRSLVFEITETVAVLSLKKALRFIRELRSMGCRFALDDFGTGTNSLKNLTELPVDHVKIDGSFVSDILTNSQSVAMVRAIVSLARDLGITTVAEYAENAEVIQRLTELGVHFAQGYGVEKPRPLAEVLEEVRGIEHGRLMRSS